MKLKKWTINDAIAQKMLMADLVPKEQKASFLKENGYLNDLSMESALMNIVQDNYYKSSQNQVMDELIKQAKEKTKQSSIETDIRQQELLYKKYEAQWRAMGVTSSDHPAMRIIAALFSQLGFNPLSLISQ